MESWLELICQYAPYAHLIIFCLLMLAGLNIPISEDVMLLTAGAIAHSCIPEHTLRLYLWVFAGCWISAWEAYWIGRLLGPRLYEIRWFNRILTRERINRLHHYYEKFGIFTFIVGRFIPGGARNALFMTSGLGKMPFLKFISRDGFACLISSSVIFSIGYKFAEHYEVIVKTFERYSLIFAIIFVTLLVGLIIWLWQRHKGDAVV